MKTRWTLLIISAVLSLFPGLPALSQDMTGETERFATALRKPIGANAPQYFEQLREKPFEEVVRINNEYILAQVSAFRTGSREYKRQLAELMHGSSLEQGLGWSNYLTEPSNLGVGGWDEKVREAVGEEGYARLVAFVQSFAVGSDEWRYTFGGERRLDLETGGLRLNNALVEAPELRVRPQRFAEQIEFSDKIRQRMFAFYEEFARRRIPQEQVVAFNRALVTVGGCVLAATDNPTHTLAFQRYNVALNLMDQALEELGF